MSQKMNVFTVRIKATLKTKDIVSPARKKLVRDMLMWRVYK